MIKRLLPWILLFLEIPTTTTIVYATGKVDKVTSINGERRPRNENSSRETEDATNSSLVPVTSASLDAKSNPKSHGFDPEVSRPKTTIYASRSGELDLKLTLITLQQQNASNDSKPDSSKSENLPDIPKSKNSIGENFSSRHTHHFGRKTSLQKDMLPFQKLKKRSIPMMVSVDSLNFNTKPPIKGNLGRLKEEPFKSLKTSELSSENIDNRIGDDYSMVNLLLALFSLDMKDCMLVISYEQDFEGSALLKVLLQLSNPRQVVKVTGADDYGTFLWKSARCRGYVLLLQNLAFLLTFGNYEDYAWDFGGRYVVVGLTKDQLEVLSRTTKISKSENFIGIVKYSRPREWGLYTSEIVKPPKGIAHYATWKGGNFTTEVTTFFPDKLDNFQGAALTLTAFDWRPSVMYEWNDAGDVVKRYGRDVMVVRGLADALNATLVFNDASQEVLWGFRAPNGTWNGLMGIIQRGEADIGVANLFISNVTMRMLVADFSVPFDIEVSCFLSRLPKPLPKWERILYPFEFTTWLSILGGLVFLGPVLYAFSRLGQVSGGERTDLQSFSYNLMYALGIQFMEGQAITPVRRGMQILVCFLWLYATIITTAYSSNLTALLTVARQPPTIDTIKQLYESKLGVGGMGAIFGTALASSTNPYLQGLSKRYDVYNGRINTMYAEVREGNIVIIAGWNVLRYMQSIEFTYRGATEARIIKETFSPFGIGLITQRGSPLKRKFDEVIIRMVENGLVRYWFLESLRMAKQEIDKKKKREQEKNVSEVDATTTDENNSGENKGAVIEVEDGGVQSLTFEHLEGFFFILLVGYIAAAIAFLFEKRTGPVIHFTHKVT